MRAGFILPEEDPKFMLKLTTIYFYVQRIHVGVCVCLSVMLKRFYAITVRELLREWKKLFWEFVQNDVCKAVLYLIVDMGPG